MKKVTFEEKRKLQLELLQEVDRFCNRHKLKYFLAYGTLLGAIRHNGFIPWDDDLDIIIPCDDFEKFLNLYSSSKYEIVFCTKENCFGYSFARMVNKETIGKCGKFYDMGVNIDIYILYGVPDSIKEQRKHLYCFFKLQKITNFFTRVKSKLARLNLWFKKDLSFYLNNFLLRRQVKILEKYNYNKCNSVFVNSGSKDIIRKELFENRIYATFEGYKFYVPVHYDEILRVWYGDYMQLPPEDQRRPYHGGDFYWK